MTVLSWSRRSALVAALASLVTACASRGAPSTAPPERNRITHEEIAAVEGRTSALVLIQRLRPNWLSGRGQTSLRSQRPAPVVVYVNNQKVGGPEQLERLVAAELREIQFLDSIAATQRFGTGHVSGAILATVR